MAENQNSDDLLLLELKVDSDKESFREASNLIEDLRREMNDSSFAFGLDEAVKALQKATSAWNSLEQKALDVNIASGDYLRFNVSPGQRKRIEALDSSNLAKEYGLTSGGVLGSLSSIISSQAQTLKLGKLNEQDWIAVTQAATKAQALGIPEASLFLGENIQETLLSSDPLNVYTSLLGMLGGLQRFAYANPKERENIEQLVSNLQSTAYLDEGAVKYVTNMVRPENPVYGPGGNPAIRMLSGDPSDAGRRGKLEQKLTGAVESTANKLDDLETKARTGLGVMSQGAYVVLGEAVADVAEPLVKLGGVLGGQLMMNMGFPAYDLNLIKNPSLYGVGAPIIAPKGANAIVGMDPDYVYSTINEEARANRWKQIYASKKASGDIVGSELALYELGLMAQANYGVQTAGLMDYASSLIAGKEKKGWGLNMRDARLRAVQEMQDPTSKYYVDYNATGASGVYAMLRASDVIDEKTYANILENMIDATVHKDILKFYDLEQDKTEVTADVNRKGEITIVVQNKETKEKKKYSYSGDPITIDSSEWNGITAD